MENQGRYENYALWLDNNRPLGSTKLPNVGVHWKTAKTFGEAKNIILRSGMPEHISLDYKLDGLETCIPFLIWLMHEYWDVNIGPNVPGYSVHAGTPEQIEEIKTLFDSWRAYAR